MAGDDELAPGAERCQRAGHPAGLHLRPHDDQGTPRMAEYLREGGVNDLREALKDLKVGDDAAKRPLIDWSLNVPVFLTIIGMAGTVLVGYVQLGDRVESFGRRLEIVEKRQADNMPRLDAQIQDNRLQDQRLQNMVEAAAEDRKARHDSEIEERKARTDIIGMIAKLAYNVAALDKTVALIQDRMGRGRTELARPEQDAQVQGPTSRPR